MKQTNIPSDQANKPVLVGHPFGPTGRGEDVRTTFRAFKAVGLPLPIRDIYGLYPSNDQDLVQEFGGALVRTLSPTLNIYHINGDEVEQAWVHLEGDLPDDTYNVIYPAWELESYPIEWAKLLERFDEVWAPSRFTFDSLQKTVSQPVYHMPLPSQVEISNFLGRRYFGIPESAYAFLFFFDFTSFMDRKNPFAVLEAFKRACSENSKEDMRLILKLNNWAQKNTEYERFISEFENFEYRDRTILIDKTLSNNEIKNLVRCCDCFVSLHRSEGFGRGMSEAMFLGKPVIATAYSGNLEFMDEQNSCLVRYDLVPVGEDQYLYAKGQVWAEPDIDHAAQYMSQLLTDRAYGRRLGAVASRHIRQHFSYRALGLRYLERVASILSNPALEHSPSKMVSGVTGM